MSLGLSPSLDEARGADQRSPTNQRAEYDDYSWKITKDGQAVGIEDPKKANHLMSAARYGLTMLAGTGSIHDPHAIARREIEVSVTRQRLKKNGAR